MGPTVKSQPNRRRYLRALAAMSPEQRLQKAFELSEWSRDLFRAGLRERFPELSSEELHALYIERMVKCHNRAS